MLLYNAIEDLYPVHALEPIMKCPEYFYRVKEAGPATRIKAKVNISFTPDSPIMMYDD